MSATGAEWTAVRSLDGHPFVLKTIAVADVMRAQELVAEQAAVCLQIENEHLVRQHGAIAMADGTLTLVLDEVNGGSLAQLLGARGQLSAGETVTTVVPLFGLLADLHAVGLVHGDLAPGNVLFSADGRPLIGDLGMTALLGRHPGLLDGTGNQRLVASGFVAPELVCGAAASPASDVFAMAALGWFCLTGTPPAPAATQASLATLRPETPSGLVEVLASCLAADPASRPSAGMAAIAVFDAAPAESVALASRTDPAAEITRRIRAAAVSVPDAAPPTRKRYQPLLAFALVGLLGALALGAGATWFLSRPQAADRPATARSVARPSLQSGTVRKATPATQPPLTPVTVPTTRPTTIARTTVAAVRTSGSSKDLAAPPSSPRMAAAGLLQGLVDARALAYVTRSASLLDLVYAPGAEGAGVDKGKIATAAKNGGTYLGLSFVVRDAVFLDGTTTTARLRATIFTPAYRTGQPDGRKIPHPQETLGPCIFSMRLTPDGWRILGLTLA